MKKEHKEEGLKRIDVTSEASERSLLAIWDCGVRNKSDYSAFSLWENCMRRKWYDRKRVLEDDSSSRVPTILPSSERVIGSSWRLNRSWQLYLRFWQRKLFIEHDSSSISWIFLLDLASLIEIARDLKSRTHCMCIRYQASFKSIDTSDNIDEINRGRDRVIYKTIRNYGLWSRNKQACLSDRKSKL